MAIVQSSMCISAQTPVIRFMVMAYEHFYNSEVWSVFLKDVDPSLYRFYFHGKNITDLRQQLANTSMQSIPYLVVETVENTYCNLSTAMNQLLSYSLKDSDSPADMFVFLSADSIPVKPFSSIYSLFIGRNGSHSSFCITPTRQWLLRKSYKRGEAYTVKHHQWIVLNYIDARKAVDKWKQNSYPPDVYKPHNLGIPWLTKKHSMCTDEYWHYAAINGLFVLRDNRTHRNFVFPHTTAQGHCAMYVHWPNYNDGSVFLKGIPRLNFPRQLMLNISTDFLKILKQSESFYFVRKIRFDTGETVLYESSNSYYKILNYKQHFAHSQYYNNLY